MYLEIVASRCSVIPIFQYSHPEITLNPGEAKQKEEKSDYPEKSKLEGCGRIVGTAKQEWKVLPRPGLSTEDSPPWAAEPPS